MLPKPEWRGELSCSAQPLLLETLDFAILKFLSFVPISVKAYNEKTNNLNDHKHVLHFGNHFLDTLSLMPFEMTQCVIVSFFD